MLKSSNILLTVRLWFYGLATFHLLFLATTVLPIDMSNDEDPRVSVYIRVRWKLITCWFNFITLAYFPICFYCDWKEKDGKWDESRVKTFRKIRDNMMTNILFPVTMYSDVTFWTLWIVDPALIAPVSIFAYLPIWAQHSLHTVSAVIIILDLLLSPRRRPHSILPGMCGAISFAVVYSAVLVSSYFQGEVVYSLFDILNTFQLTLFVLYTYSSLIFYYIIQWYIIEFRWGRVRRMDSNGVNEMGKHKIK